jgi:hypothetical protein
MRRKLLWLSIAAHSALSLPAFSQTPTEPVFLNCEGMITGQNLSQQMNIANSALTIDFQRSTFDSIFGKVKITDVTDQNIFVESNYVGNSKVNYLVFGTISRVNGSVLLQIATPDQLNRFKAGQTTVFERTAVLQCVTASRKF